VYRKSGLRSRADLSAFFLEDLLLPAWGKTRAGGENSPRLAADLHNLLDFQAK
jgi:hypothetical protein